MTRRQRRYIVRQALLPEESFEGIARRVGKSARNVRDIFEEHRAHLDAIRAIETPRVMGIDGVYVKRKESLVVTDLERRRPVMLRPVIKERAVAAALREMPNLDKVKGWCRTCRGRWIGCRKRYYRTPFAPQQQR
jgi:transposase